MDETAVNRLKELLQVPNPLDGALATEFGIRRDQNGVVWAERGIMSRRCYEQLRGLDDPAFGDLPLWDSHNQNIVDVD